MSYIGKIPQTANFIKLDNISSLFNGSNIEFDLTTNGVPVSIPSTRQMCISLNGVIQEPGVSFFPGSNNQRIRFTEAPQTGSEFFGIISGVSFDAFVPTDGSVTNNKLDEGSVSTSKIQNNAVTADKILNGAVTNAKILDNSVTLQKIQDNAVTYTKIATSAKTSVIADIISGALDKLTRAKDVLDFVNSLAIGIGQTWTDVTLLRAFATPYINSTGKPIQIHVRATATTVGQRLVITIDGVEAGASSGQGTSSATGSLSGIIIPPGATYTVTTTGGHTLTYWAELR